MSSLKQTIRTVLVDVETFLVESLKSVKLNTNAKDQKDRLLEKIRQLLEEIPGSAGSHVDSNASGGSQKISGGGDSSSGSSSTTPRQTTTADDDAGYSDDIAKVAVSDLKNKLQSGLLERKKKSGFKSWEQFYCVVSGNIFYFYKKQTDSKQKEAFCLNGYEFREAPDLDKDTSKKDMCFEVVKAAARSYQFRAGSNEGMMHWREAITKGSQIADDDEPGELYEDMGQGHDSEEKLPPPPEALFEDLDDIYEECAENTDVGPPPPPLPPPASSKPLPPPPDLESESPDDVYDACSSVMQEVEEKVSSPPALPPGKRREPPPPPVSDLPPPPPPKAELPAIPKSLPPPIPDRRPSNAELPPPPVPNHPPPLPTRGGSSATRVPQLRKPFMDRDEDFENLYYGKWDCSADSNKELAFKQGEMIHVLSRDFEAESWWVGELEGRVGLVPKEYLCPAFEMVP